MYDTKKVNQWTEYSSTGISQSQTTDVCVFGKGYLEETPVDGKPAITKIKHQKRNSKGNLPPTFKAWVLPLFRVTNKSVNTIYILEVLINQLILFQFLH